MIEDIIRLSQLDAKLEMEQEEISLYELSKDVSEVLADALVSLPEVLVSVSETWVLSAVVDDVSAAPPQPASKRIAASEIAASNKGFFISYKLLPN